MRAANSDTAGPSSTSCAPPMIATAVAPMQHLGLEEVAEREREVVERADEVRRHEAHDEVGVVAVERFEDLARGLTDRVGRDRVLRQRRRVLRHRGMVRGFSIDETAAGRDRSPRHPPVGSPIPWPPPTCSRRPIRPSSSPGTESRCAESRRVRSPDEAVAAAEQVGYPVVVKLNGAGIAHKTERGLVRLDLADAGRGPRRRRSRCSPPRAPTTATSTCSSRAWSPAPAS